MMPLGQRPRWRINPSTWFPLTTHLHWVLLVQMNSGSQLGMVVYTSVTSALGRLRQQDSDFKTSLDYTARRKSKEIREGGGRGGEERRVEKEEEKRQGRKRKKETEKTALKQTSPTEWRTEK